MFQITKNHKTGGAMKDENKWWKYISSAIWSTKYGSID